MVTWQSLSKQAERLSWRDRLALIWRLVRSLGFQQRDLPPELDQAKIDRLATDQRQKFLESIVARMQASSLPENTPHLSREMLYERD